jgi:L-ribulose-5-phosphate 3-epimerase
MFFGYNTNGMAHHDLFEAVALLAELGYRGVAITIDHGPLWPRRESTAREIGRLKRLLDETGMRSVIETGGRFVLDPRVKHEPTLVSADPRRRIEFYKYACDLAAELGSDCVSLWSGKVRDAAARDEAAKRLVQGLHEVLDYAAGQGVVIAMEPEPDMLVDSTPEFEKLIIQNELSALRLTLDIGHLHCQGETPIAAVIRRSSGRLANVHLDDMKAGVHEHLMFGEGEIDFAPAMAALSGSGYAGGVYVELNRHSHAAAHATKKAFGFLSQFADLL